MSEGKLDPRLRFLQEQNAADRFELAEALRIAPSMSVRPVMTVDLALRCRKEFGAESAYVIQGKLRALGVEISAVVDGPDLVVSGSVAVDQLDGLMQEDWIELIEASQQLFPDLDLSCVDVGVRNVHAMTPPVRGGNVLVGVIDGGIDFTHDDFRDAAGNSRIRFLWDQRVPSIPGGRVPYGREYTRADLDAALRTNPAPVPISHVDGGGHGTHVAGIAAGNGRRAGGQFTGMAPDAELVVVAMRGDAGTLGESTSAIAAVNYVADRARELGRAVAINMSQGMNGGGHSGEMPLETAMDNLARRAGIVLVKSAGNEQEWRIHASGTVQQGQTLTRRFESSGNNTQQDVLEVWFDAADRMAIAVQAPGAALPGVNDFVPAGQMNTFQTTSGNSVRIDARMVDAGQTGDVRAMVFIGRGSASRIQPGRWTLHVRGDQVVDGRFHTWIERTGRTPNPGGIEQSRFTTTDHDPTCTISVPGTARRIITVGSYATRHNGGAAVGDLSSFSSRGPTRYGSRKPELSAPGEWIVSALSSAYPAPPFAPGYTSMPGTSMAAPHVTGVAALLLEINPRFTCDQVKQLLVRAARTDGAAASAPDDSWGAGRLTVRRAVDLARTVRFPVISNVAASGAKIEWDTDIPTTGAVRFNSHQRRMLLGRALGSRASLTSGTHHAIDLSGLASASYFCEILAFTPQPDEWVTLDDNDGNHFVVAVP